MKSWIPFVLLAGCQPGGAVDVAEQESGVDSQNSESGLTDSGVEDSGRSDNLFEWCFDFEDGLLSPFGYEEVAVELSGGAQLASVSEGEQFSALTAEDRIEFRGSYAGLMRAYPRGDSLSWRLPQPLFRGQSIGVQLVAAL